LPQPDEHTFVALVSKGYPTDEAALRRILDSPAAYIGMIGSKRKRETVFANLRADGVAEEQLARVQAPIGLNIGAETPQEIAVSILAQIIQSVRSAVTTAAIPMNSVAAVVLAAGMSQRMGRVKPLLPFGDSR
jgi:xanthine/CO dehydrogenase XdhC/CoxF family maturation factor